MRICLDPLEGPHFRPKKWFYLISYIRIMSQMWDLGLVLCDSPKDAVSGKFLVFGNILCFPGVNWAQIQTKTVNFGYVPFPLKHIFFKDCSYSVIGLSYTTSGPNFSKIGPYLGGERAQKTPKIGHFMDAASPRNNLKFYNLGTTNAIKMKLTTIIYLHETFHLA